jgi:hypothetical protein
LIISIFATWCSLHRPSISAQSRVFGVVVVVGAGVGKHNMTFGLNGASTFVSRLDGVVRMLIMCLFILPDMLCLLGESACV